MKDLYVYNKGSHTLHINGFCKDAKGRDLLVFKSENSAVKYAGRALRMCEKCMVKREEILALYVKQESAKITKKYDD